MVDRDERTTPGWLRIPALLLLAFTATWFGLSYSFALNSQQPTWARPHPWVWWFANWEMFTMLDDYATVVRGEALYDGKWVPIDLEALFPTQWDSGPRYARSDFYRDSLRMRTFGEATCNRLDRKPEKVRYYRIVWKKELGVSSKPAPTGMRPRPLTEWTCGQRVHHPMGVRL
ncbi:MAG: hypothetical protein KC621_14600 [Myxococcales bacterium]|nr:hypothetical protein [Myxococcales bacterium]